MNEYVISFKLCPSILMRRKLACLHLKGYSWQSDLVPNLKFKVDPQPDFDDDDLWLNYYEDQQRGQIINYGEYYNPDNEVKAHLENLRLLKYALTVSLENYPDRTDYSFEKMCKHEKMLDKELCFLREKCDISRKREERAPKRKLSD